MKNCAADIPGIDLLVSLELPISWTKYHNKESVYQFYSLTTGPGCGHREYALVNCNAKYASNFMQANFITKTLI